MISALEAYRQMWKQLVFIRGIHKGGLSVEEDQLLEKMDDLWLKLTDNEKELINQEPAKQAG